MVTIERPALVDEAGNLTLSVTVPSDVSPGLHRVVLLIEEALVPAHEKPEIGATLPNDETFDFPVFHHGQAAPDLGSLRRVDLYDDTGGR